MRARRRPDVVVAGASAVLAQLGGDELVGAFEGEPPGARAALLALMSDRMGEAGLRLLFSRAQAGGFEGARCVVGAARLTSRRPPEGGLSPRRGDTPGPTPAHFALAARNRRGVEKNQATGPGAWPSG